jgi:branched-chain amino acid transport system ATP-binding protein
MLKVNQIYSAYGEAQVLNGISIEVGMGEIVAILGRNGMGKTSLVRSIMNLNEPKKTSGTVLMESKDISNVSPYQISRLGVGYVPQGRRLFQSLTVLEHLKILENSSPGSWTIEQALQEFPRLNERKFHRGNQLSGGERQMLAIARALMTGPKVLLMDEPTEGLAPVTVELVEEILKKLKNNGLGILLVEQNFYSAMAIADRVYIIESGQVVWTGVPKLLLESVDIQQQYLGIH